MRRTAPLVPAIFFLSGAAGLVYQVVWTKELVLQFGVTAHAVSTTVSVFMLGLALGSWVFGRVADRVRRPLAAYALLELGIAASALVSLALLRAVDALVASSWIPELGGPGIAAIRTLGTFLVLVVPSTLMGGTLPMLAKELVTNGGTAGRSVGVLYGLNALGGAAGSVLTGFVTIGWLGLRASLLVGVGLNGLAAALAFALVRRGPSPSASRPDRTPPPQASVERAPTGILVAFFLAGLTGLGLEVAWTRMLLLNLNSTAQSFAAMLAVCLLGLAAGSVATSRLADRWDPVRSYGVTQGLVGLSVLGCAALWARMHPSSIDVGRWAVGLLPNAVRGEAAHQLAVCTYQCVLLLLAPTFLMGCSFPFAARAFGRSDPQLGRRLGAAFTLNTLGSMLGPLLCGFLLLPWLGIQRTVVVFGTISIAAGAALLYGAARAPRRWVVASVSLAVIVAAWLLPSDVVLAGVYRRSTAKLLHYEEDVAGSVAVREIDSGGERVRQLLVGSTSMITDGFSCRRYTRILGHLPMLLHPGPRDALVICLGSGMTLSALGAHPDVTSIDCVELSPGVVRAAREWFGAANGHVLEDPRVRVIVNDGRTQLRFSPKRYDVITLEPPPPNCDGVAALYSREFYELCRSRLRPGGILSQWIPYHGASPMQIRSMLAAVRAAFPHTTLWEMFDGREYCVVGRLDDAQIPWGRVAGRFAVPGVQAHLQEVGISRLEDLFSCFVLGPQGMVAFVDGARPVTDDLPGLGYDWEAVNLLAPWVPRFERALQEAGLATEAHAEDPARYLGFPTFEAEAQFVARLAPVKAVWRMHTLALRLFTLTPEEHTGVFRQRFQAPNLLEPDNPYYAYTARRGLYTSARARQRLFLEQGGH